MRQFDLITKKQILYYKTSNGKTPVTEWLTGIKDYCTQSRIETRIKRLLVGLYGNCKMLGEGLGELRLDFGPGYRIYFSEENQNILLLLCGGDKSSQNKDITIAKAYLKEYRHAKKKK